jgi:hypothetical protein
MKVLRFFSILIVFALLMAAVTPVAAAAPIHYVIDQSGTDTFDCGTFTIYDDYTLHYVGDNYVDAQGNWVRSQEQNSFTDRFYNPANGKEVSGKGKMNRFFYPDYARNAGLAYHVVLPGVGAILIDAGTMQFYAEGIVFHGNHMFYVEGDLSKVCEALE